jgi:hypothetical protein
MYFLGEPMLLHFCTLSKETLEEFLEENEKMSRSETKDQRKKSEKFSFLSLTEIDHMRDRKKYLKILSNWANELVIFGRVLFCSDSRRIFLLLSSEEENNLKEFHFRLRTSIVDVDSSGRPCKERMSTVLCPPVKIDRKIVFKDFVVFQVPNEKAKDLKTFFANHELGDIFQSYVKPK